MIEARPQFPQFFDLDGSPLDDGYVYVGTANTNPETSTITAYWDKGGTQPAAQPMRTSGGVIVRGGTAARFYVSRCHYSIAVRDKRGRLVWNEPDIESRNGDFVNVMDFGAVGDGTADDTKAIQSAHDSLPSTGGTIWFPAGSYYVPSAITSSKRSIRWLADGTSAYDAQGCVELWTDQASIIMDLGTAGSTVSGGHVIDGLGFRDASGTGIGAIRMRRMNHARLVNVGVRNFTTGYAVSIDGTGDACIMTEIHGPRFRNNKYGVRGSGTLVATTVIGGYISIPTASPIAGSIGVDINSPTGDTPSVLETGIDNYDTGVKLSTDSAIISARFEMQPAVPHTAYVHINSGTGNHVVNSKFQNGVNGIRLTTNSTVFIGPNHWAGTQTGAQIDIGTNLAYYINEPQLSDYRIGRSVQQVAPIAFRVMQLSGAVDRHAQLTAEAGSTVGILRATTETDGTRRVYVGSTSGASDVRLVRANSGTGVLEAKATLRSAGFFFGDGTTGAAITGHLSATASLNFPDTVSGSTNDLTIAVVGADPGDTVVLGLPASAMTPAPDPSGVYGYTAWVSASDVVTIRFWNDAGANRNPGLGTYRVDVWKH